MGETLRVASWPATKNRSKNPYNFLLSHALISLGVEVTEFRPGKILLRTPDVLHVHWPDDFQHAKNSPLALAKLVATLALIFASRIQGASIVWTAHNHRPHNVKYQKLQRIHEYFFPLMIDAVIHLTQTSKESLQGSKYWQYRKAFHVVIPHGPYELDPHRNELEANASLLALGQIRPYKELDRVIESWHKAQSTRTLYIAGAGEPTYVAGLRSMAADAQTGRIDFENRWLSDADVSMLVRQSSALLVSGERPNSGAIYLALSGGRPVIAYSSAFNIELRQRYGDDAVFLYSSYDQIPNLFESVLMDASPSTPEALRGRLDTWSSIAKSTREVYKHASREKHV